MSEAPAGWCRWDGEDLLLQVQLQPRASRNELAGTHGDALKIRLTAPPVDGKANTALIAFLAEIFGVSRRDVTLQRGQTARTKQLRIRRPRQLPPELSVPPRRPA